MENKQVFEGFLGPSYQGRSGAYDSQDTINFYLELDETGLGKNGQKFILIGTPGLRNSETIGTKKIRAIYTDSTKTKTYIVSGDEVWSKSSLEASPIKLEGNLLTDSGSLSIVDNGISVVFVDGMYGYYSDITSNKLTQIVSENFYPSSYVTFQDGYFIFTQVGTNLFFLSDLYSTDFLALNQSAKSGSTDDLVAALSLNRQLYLLGSNTLEIWYNGGQSGSSPFIRQDGRFSQIGCSSVGSISVLGEQFFWVGSNNQGNGVVYTLEGALPKRISTHAVEHSLQQTSLSKCTAFSYQQEGHYFYCLNVPGLDYTWVFDMVTQTWTKRQDYTDGVPERWYAESHAVIGDTHITGDYRNNNIYIIDLDCYTDNNQPKYYIRQTPHISANLNRVFYKMLSIDFQFGVGNEAEIEPIVSLYVSNNGGKTFGNALNTSLGQIGQYTKRARFHRLGSSRDRVFKVIISTKTRVEMLMAMIDVDIGQQ